VKILIALLAVFSVATCMAQDSLRYYMNKSYKEVAVIVGYNYSSGHSKLQPDMRSQRFIEAGVWRALVAVRPHPIMFAYYGSTDFGVNNEKFMIGPKFGGFVSMAVIGVGSELAYYTDFHGGSLHYIPQFGLFTRWFKLTVSPHLALTNLDYLPSLSFASFNLTVRLFKIERTEPW
jgi:hypothetical protein